MRDMRAGTVLIVGGSAEAHALACRLPGALVLLPAPERVARAWPKPPLTGPLYPETLDPETLSARGIAAVIEAAHPCDAATAFAAARAARLAGVPHLQLVRPGWRAGRGDAWTRLARVVEVPRRIAPGARVFTTLGRAALPGLRAHAGPVFARSIGPARRGFPLRRGRFVPGEGPFTAAEEAALLRRLRIDWLVLRDAGGPGGWPKLAAARALGLPVALIDRPARPAGPRVATVKEALAWLATTRISAG